MQEKENIDIDIVSTDKNEVGDDRVYEVGYLLVPEISEEDLSSVYGNIKETIISFGGTLISDEAPSVINLAYTMQKTIQNVNKKYDSAYFGWVKFYMDSSDVLSLKKKLDLNDQIIRFLIIKTVKENTLAPKKFTNKDSIRKKSAVMKTPESSSENNVINKEEIDKEIDAMVAE